MTMCNVVTETNTRYVALAIPTAKMPASRKRTFCWSEGVCALTTNDLWATGILQMFLDRRELREPASLLLNIVGALCVSAAFMAAIVGCLVV